MLISGKNGYKHLGIDNLVVWLLLEVSFELWSEPIKVDDTSFDVIVAVVVVVVVVVGFGKGVGVGPEWDKVDRKELFVSDFVPFCSFLLLGSSIETLFINNKESQDPEAPLSLINFFDRDRSIIKKIERWKYLEVLW